jgi:Cu(I)/Ag(I) efflux system membrane fusion protein
MMSKRQKIAVVWLGLFGLIAAFYGMYLLGKHQNPQAADTMSPKANQNSAKKVLYWHDPMVPSQKFDKPGKSPFMDMQLVPVYAESNATESNQGDSPAVTISPSLQQNLGIRTAPVMTGQLSNSLEVVGNVALDERAMVIVPARAAGVIQHLSVRAAFDPVQRGQVLATVYVPDWIAAQEEYLAVRKMKGDGLEGLKSGARQRMLLVGMSDAQVKLVESSGIVQAHIPVTAPTSGVLAELNVREGETLSMGAPMFKITRLDPIWLNAEIPESAAAQAHVGSAVAITTAALPNQVLQGRVAQLLPSVNTTTRTLTARITLANPHQALIPGMFVQVRFVASNHADSLLVPSEAVIVTGKRSLVFVVQANGRCPNRTRVTGTNANPQWFECGTTGRGLRSVSVGFRSQFKRRDQPHVAYGSNV